MITFMQHIEEQYELGYEYPSQYGIVYREA